jgi:hypothetical protein
MLIWLLYFDLWLPINLTSIYTSRLTSKLFVIFADNELNFTTKQAKPGAITIIQRDFDFDA